MSTSAASSVLTRDDVLLEQTSVPFGPGTHTRGVLQSLTCWHRPPSPCKVGGELQASTAEHAPKASANLAVTVLSLAEPVTRAVGATRSRRRAPDAREVTPA